MARSFTALKIKYSLSAGHLLVKNRIDDAYILAHPRSGSTWLRTVVVNILQPDAQSNPDVFNRLIPGISIRSALGKINRLPSPRVISSHTWYRSGIPRAIYVVRDGRDVLVSFYHYLTTRGNQKCEGGFEKFFELYCGGSFGYFWPTHVESWLQKGKASMGERLMVIRFEDMKANSQEVFSSIINFLGISASEDQLESAIQAASIGRMREIEKSRRGAIETANASFYRGGKSGQWEEYFTPAIEEKFNEISAKAMNLAGYSF